MQYHASGPPARRAAVLAAAVVAVATAGGLVAGDPGPAARVRPDVIYLPSPQEVVDRMLEMAEIRPGDVLYDLGCGDGRVLVTAAKRYGIKAVGFDIDPERVRASRKNAAENGVAHLVTVTQQDMFIADFHDATVVTLYLPPNLNLRLKPKLARLRPGARILSHSFAMKGARPERVEKVRTAGRGDRNVFLWKVPWRDDAL